MTSRLKKAGVSAVVGLGLLGGAAAISAAATGGSGSAAAPATTDAADTANDTADANDAADANGDQGDSNGQDEPPAYTSSITAPVVQGVNEGDEAAALAALATVTPDEASAAATAAVSGTVNKVDLENENGSVVYSVEIQTATGTVDVVIDVGTEQFSPS